MMPVLVLMERSNVAVAVVVLVVVLLKERVVFEVSELNCVLKEGPPAKANWGLGLRNALVWFMKLLKVSICSLILPWSAAV